MEGAAVGAYTTAETDSSTAVVMVGGEGERGSAKGEAGEATVEAGEATGEAGFGVRGEGAAGLWVGVTVPCRLIASSSL